MAVHRAGRRPQARLEGRVEITRSLPVRLHGGQRGQVDPGRAPGVVGGGDQRGHVRLAGPTRQRRGRSVDGVRAGVGRREQGGELTAGGVVGVYLDGQVEVRPQRRHQDARRGRSQEPRHVLDREYVGAGGDESFGQAEIVVEGIDRFCRIRQVTGVTQRALGDRASLDDRVDRRPHLLDVVQRVEHAEDVDTGCGRLGDERPDHVIGVRGVTDRVASAQQHLQADVRYPLADGGETFPRVLRQEPQRHIVGRPAPALQAQQLGGEPGVRGRRRENLSGPQAGGQQRLMGVTQGGVGDRELLGRPQPRRPFPWSELGEKLTGPGRRHGGGQRRQYGHRVDQRAGRSLVAVDGAVREPVQQTAGPVGSAVTDRQSGPVVQEGRGHPSGQEVRLCQQPAQERQVRAHTADPELRQRPAGPPGGLLEGGAPGRHLDQQRVEVRGDLRTLVGRPVQPNSRAARGLVSGDLPDVRAEAVRRVLGGHPALHRGPADRDRFLGEAQVGQSRTGGDPQLGRDQIDTGDLLGHGVLDLDARVHLHEGV